LNFHYAKTIDKEFGDFGVGAKEIFESIKSFKKTIKIFGCSSIRNETII